jgi:hypothetical protein
MAKVSKDRMIPILSNFVIDVSPDTNTEKIKYG